LQILFDGQLGFNHINFGFYSNLFAIVKFLTSLADFV